MSRDVPGRSVRKGRHRGSSALRRGVVLAGVIAIAAATVAGRVGLTASDTAGDEASTPSTHTQATVEAPQPVDRSRAPAPRRSPEVLPAEDRPIPIPRSGPGRFRVSDGMSPTQGLGPLLTYTVEVENNLPYDPKIVTRFVEQVLTGDRGWLPVAQRSIRRVDRDPTIHIRLATPSTTDELCAPLQTRGRLSCRNGDLVVLNAWRWANGAAGYDRLSSYRTYMVNHEVGHALGYAHRECPVRGAKAPVMMQQTKGLEGCVANPWPRKQ